MDQKRGLWIGLWLILVVVVGFLAFGHGGSGYGVWHGWGRMGDWDDGYRAERSSRWYGMAPGMMGTLGYGMHGGGAYGNMGGYGGMMGQGGGMGYGMPWGLPTDLTPEQSEKSSQLLAEAAVRNRDVMQQIWETQARLNNLYQAEHRDWKVIREANRRLLELQRQQSEQAIDLQQKLDSLLTDRQRQEMAQAWRGHGWSVER